MKLFLAKYCSKYTIGNPSYKADGFGFAFPLGSPLVADVSRGILKVIMGEKMNHTENEWLKPKSSCSSSSRNSTSTSLDLSSFWGLFLIAGTASAVALISCAISFVYKQRHLLLRMDPTTTSWDKIRTLLRVYNQRDLTSHTFKNINERRGVGVSTGDEGMCSDVDSPPDCSFNKDAGGDGASPNNSPEIELSIQNPEMLAR